MECLEEYVYDEILELNTHILDTLPEEEIVHFWNVTLQGFKARRLINSNICTLKDGACVTKYFVVFNKLDKLVVQNTA